MAEFETIDLEFVMMPNFDKEKQLIIGVKSTMADCSCWVKFTDKEVKKGGTPFILQTLNDLKEALVFQYTNGLNKDIN